VLENAIDDELVDSLYETMCKDVDRFISTPNRRWNVKDSGNISMIPPLNEQWLRKDFYANPHLVRILENLLGPEPEIRFLNSNVAVPQKNSPNGGAAAIQRQAVHADASHNFPDMPFGIVVNTYIQDSSADNGVTEIWLGTHEHASRDQFVSRDMPYIREDFFCHRAKVSPPMQPKLRKGSMCIRDLRLWHAGMPNHSDKPRIMLAVDYFSAIYRCPMTIRLPASLRSKIEKDWEGISLAGVEWVDGELDNLNEPFRLNMTQDPAALRVEKNGKMEDQSARETGVFEYEDKRRVTEHNYWHGQEVY